MSGKRLLAVLLGLLLLSGCGTAPAHEKESHPYGVFLSVTEDLSRLSAYETVVIDAQYFTAEELRAFQAQGHKIYTYLNVGALEDFREYYEAWSNLALGDYVNWEEEAWMDVSQAQWQDFLLEELVPSLLEKGVDGFFVDNCDVYYEFPTEPIFHGLVRILQGLRATGREVLLNGGDFFLTTYCDTGGDWSELITGVNQETVFTRILWDAETFDRADPEDQAYFSAYVERFAAAGAEVHLLEYTSDPALTEEIEAYCAEHGFFCYVSHTLELEAP